MRLILTVSVSLLILSGCNNTRQRIKQELEKVCHCSGVEITEHNANNFDYIAFSLKDSKFSDEVKEIIRIWSHIMQEVPEVCSMEEKIVIQFEVDNNGYIKYYPHVYLKCVLQFEF